ncbi:cation:dicarboxylase symporter family transporter [Sphingomonas sp. CGMCC 1.13654]|uniref:Cation:dicarboxylase symporter family transporter n=1 Tax=Sphingomonas chungangi TaxID=2683589 RepID=A0A838L496_9SPHN|nr:cation:dicarboxylase symporter family transporter [Sphingomonas chungangi]MBA2934323.1 cation:dicarboxylase symporter family transporter [Sphingomonas chungangi]MVW57364.1 cation:dicarboxylase symporter family transporter [Sphingomonas chungangi]
MNRGIAALLALGGGVMAGIAVRASHDGHLAMAARLVLPLGTLWLNALRMTLVPLVFAMVAQGMITLDRSGGGGGRLLGITLPLVLGLLFLAVAIGIGLAVVFDAIWPVTRGVLAGMVAVPGGPGAVAIPSVPPISELVLGLVPTNPVAAASNGTMASIVVFAIIFGFAVSRTSPRGDEPLIRMITGLADAMVWIVHGVLRFTPIGIFALSLGLALDTGLSIAGLWAQLQIASALGGVAAIALGYGIAWIGGGVPPLRFGRAILDAQAMAAGTCSSTATLPVMIEASTQRLHVPPAVGGAVLPLAVSIFRLGVPLYAGMVLVLLMRGMNLPLDPAKMALAAALLVLTNIGSAGLPGAAVIYANWIASLQVLDLPIEVVPLMIAGFSLPDIFVTTGNVTADLALTTIVARLLGRERTPAADVASPAATFAE